MNEQNMKLTENFFEETYEKYRQNRMQIIRNTIRLTLQMMKEDVVRLRDNKTLLHQFHTHSYNIIEALKLELLKLC